MLNKKQIVFPKGHSKNPDDNNKKEHGYIFGKYVKFIQKYLKYLMKLY